jgi:pimeloyl-ACP methyl ester carboxylesterase
MKLKMLLRIGIASAVLVGSGISICRPGALDGGPLFLSAAAASPDDPAVRCAQLAGKQLGGAAVTRAEYVAPGAVLPPFRDKTAFGFCRVDARISPGAASLIKIQVWLPTNWNGKFLGAGGGGFNGGLASASLGLRGPASQGYAAVATDAGHDVSLSPDWALGHPEKTVDFGHRANHLGAVVGKAVVADYYGSPAKRAYFHGCSNGGRDALMLAQRYPDDYDGIVAGAPANDWIALLTSFVRNERVARLSPGVDTLGPKLKLLHEAAMNKCDAADGLKDGLIERPSSCRFDPAVLECKPGSTTDCLSKAEVSVAKAIYRGPVTRSGRQLMSGFPVGSEYEWGSWITSPKSLAGGMGRDFFRYLVYEDRSWDETRFDLGRDYAFANGKLGSSLAAVDPNLAPFVRKGGRLLMYHGWDDAAIPAGSTLRYYDAVRRTLGNRAADHTRLFMLPGVAHCAGGHGPDNIDYVAVLDRWTESGVAPEQLVATKYDSQFRAGAGLPARALRTRPVCAWPKTARYLGSGAVEDASSYICR